MTLKQKKEETPAELRTSTELKRASHPNAAVMVGKRKPALGPRAGKVHVFKLEPQVSFVLSGHISPLNVTQHCRVIKCLQDLQTACLTAGNGSSKALRFGTSAPRTRDAHTWAVPAQHRVGCSRRQQPAPSRGWGQRGWGPAGLGLPHCERSSGETSPSSPHHLQPLTMSLQLSKKQL